MERLMGFRSMVMSEDCSIIWPTWFVIKYENDIRFNVRRIGPLYSFHEIKLYAEHLTDFPSDVQKAIDWDHYQTCRPPERKQFLIIFFHECGGVTRLHITRDSIRWSEPTEWEEVEGITHHDCLYCSKI